MDLTAQGGPSTTFQLAIDRGAGKVAQWTYGKASNTGTRDFLGSAVAIDGDTLVVGASGESSAAATVNGDQTNDNAPSAGAAYVFRRSGGRWIQEAYLKASNTETFDDFGVSVAISGNTIAVGAHAEDSASVGVNQDQTNNNANHSGAVYVYRRSGSTWAQEAYVKASNTGQQDNFGFAVALSGNTLAVGAFGEAGPASGINQGQGDGAPAAGAVYVFQRIGSTWSQQAYLKASNTQQNYVFGEQLALDGDTLAVGSVGESSSATGVMHQGVQYAGDRRIRVGGLCVRRHVAGGIPPGIERRHRNRRQPDRRWGERFRRCLCIRAGRSYVVPARLSQGIEHGPERPVWLRGRGVR